MTAELADEVERTIVEIERELHVRLEPVQRVDLRFVLERFAEQCARRGIGRFEPWGGEGETDAGVPRAP
jgi:hypothetical protein